MSLKAIIMAAGLGTRMRPLTDHTPKPMLLVAGRPILERTIDSLPPEITDVIIVVGYLKEKIEAHFGHEWHGRAITYVEQQDLTGTAGAVHECRALIDDRALVLNADDIYAPEDIARVAAHRYAVLGLEVDDAGRFGAFETDTDGRLLRLAPDGSVHGRATVNIGVYSLDRRFFDYEQVPTKIGGKETGVPHTIASMARDVDIRVILASFWAPVGYPEDLEKVVAALKAAGRA